MSEQKFAAIRLDFNHVAPPVFKEAKDGDLLMYGDDVKYPYPDYLIDLKNKSARHGSIIRSKVRYICGNGWSVDEFGLSPSQVSEIQRLVKFANDSETLDEITLKLCDDFETFGGFAVECIWDKGRKKIAQYAHLPFNLIRVLRVKDNEYKYCYLPDWRNVKKYDVAKDKEGFKEFDVLGSGTGDSEILYITDSRQAKSGESSVYPIPVYSGAVPLIEADAEIANFRLNNVKNGFWASKIITFNNGVPTLEEQNAIKRGIVNQHSGSDNAGTFALMFSDGNNPPTVVDLTGGDLDKQFLDVDKAIETTIGTAHGVTSMTLFGVATEGALGQRDQMLDAYQLFRGNYVVPRQKTIEDAINYIYSFNGLDARLRLKPVDILVTSTGDDDGSSQVLSKLNGLSPLLATKVLETMSVDEIRGIVGLQPKSKTFEAQHPDILEYFNSVGVDSSDYEILAEFDNDGSEFTDEQFTAMAFAKVMDLGEDDFASKVLSMINSDPTVTPERIAQALNTDVPRVQKTIGELLADKVLVGEIGNLKISAPAKRDIRDSDEEIITIETKYQYSGPLDSKNRDFCARLLGLGKLYSRKDIESMPASPEALQEIDSVWKYRGGWWTRKGTDNTTPYCRHTWRTVVVKKK